MEALSISSIAGINPDTGFVTVRDTVTKSTVTFRVMSPHVDIDGETSARLFANELRGILDRYSALMESN